MIVVGQGKYHPDMQDFLGAETKQLTLRQCAQADAFKHGSGAVLELQEKWRQRKYRKQSGRKTNIGDPMRGMSSGGKRK